MVPFRVFEPNRYLNYNFVSFSPGIRNSTIKGCIFSLYVVLELVPLVEGGKQLQATPTKQDLGTC